MKNYPLKTIALCLSILWASPHVWANTAETGGDEAASKTELNAIVVEGMRNVRDAAGHDKVYEEDISSVYKGLQEIDTYRGTSPADLFKGMVGVQMGDARNSGGIDPNVRGIQGQGRVPVTVDGTEQAITVWRGYNGANNRNYIDPMLISSIRVEKGPSLNRSLQNSIGGGVEIRTLSIDDVVEKGKTYGVDVRFEASNNAVKERADYSQYIGKSVPDWAREKYGSKWIAGMTSVEAKQQRFNSFGHDQAYRIAAGIKQDKFDFLAAFAHRDRGNYFAGKGGVERYIGEESDQLIKGGYEVPNTSNKTQSILLKGTWRPSENQAVQLGYSRIRSDYGDIMPSRISGTMGLGDFYREYQDQRLLPQWPLSSVGLDAYYLNYSWKPQNPWLDVKAGIWTTRAKTTTQNSGGFPLDAKGQNPIVNSSLYTADNNRWGVNLSNKISLTDTLALTLAGNYQQEDLDSKDRWWKDPDQPDSFRSRPRQGTRKEYKFDFNFDWQPTEKLAISAGARWNGYSSFDKGLQQILNDKDDPNYNGYVMMMNARKTGYKLNYYTELTDPAVIAAFKEYEKDWRSSALENLGYYTGGCQSDSDSSRCINTDASNYGQLFHSIVWEMNANGKASRANNPFLNGEAQKNGWIRPEGALQALPIYDYSGANTQVDKRKASSGWSPVLSASYRLNDNHRIYGRWTQATRMPSLFESTVAFSAGFLGTQQIKPEKATNVEVGYVYDFRNLFDKQPASADIKLAWYRNSIKNPIDRDVNLFFIQVDKWETSGLELQARYDNGRFFTDIGASYTLKNRICDEDQAALYDPYQGRIPNCVEDGFRSGYIQNMQPPKYSFNWGVGGRFFNDKLELGSRLTHHAGWRNNGPKNFGELWPYYQNTFNDTIRWHSVTVWDAYARYRINKHITAEISGNNLTNRYYLDPLTRSEMPAPGRTLKFSLSGKF
ncbi:TonB-dependent receptor [Uruburuella testudinis]|uniref:TonB-dependent receptor n=1 Tax=Uruburuella testudinis TaxID=1282863 RepID=A0ABY4DPH3_9NEIS|nr:TonB-dependent receptor [Uruburuella testudinis]UOO80941.1 TonB-dependent receptor [Uruburuella testudinis]